MGLIVQDFAGFKTRVLIFIHLFFIFCKTQQLYFDFCFENKLLKKFSLKSLILTLERSQK